MPLSPLDHTALIERAEKGDAFSQYQLALAYSNGEYLPQDFEEAARWLHKAAVQNHIDAQLLMGARFAGGKGLPKDYVEAARWFRKAADHGNAKAQNMLGRSYATGKGVKQSYADAIEWFRKAALQGDADAQQALIICEAEAAENKIRQENLPARTRIEKAIRDKLEKDKKPFTLKTLNGGGFMMYGFYPITREGDQVLGLSLYAFCFFYIPLIPLGLYLNENDGTSYRFYGSVPISNVFKEMGFSQRFSFISSIFASMLITQLAVAIMILVAAYLSSL